jgi:hypothetical protein
LLGENPLGKYRAKGATLPLVDGTGSSKTFASKSAIDERIKAVFLNLLVLVYGSVNERHTYKVAG